MRRFSIVVDDKSGFDVELQPSGETRINDRSIVFQIQDWKNDRVDINVQSKHYLAHVRALDEEHLEVWIGSSVYTVYVQDDRARLLSQFARSQSRDHSTLDVRAPMPGLVRAIHSKISDTVRTGDSLLVLEAMKMENEVKSPTNGIITAVHVQPHTSVEKGQALITIQPVNQDNP